MRSTEIFLLTSTLVACASQPAVVSRPLPSGVKDVDVDVLEDKHLEVLASSEASDTAYRVGAGDSLLIAVFQHPELSISSYAGFGASAGSGRSGGVAVDTDGTIQFPMLGNIKVAGMTTNEIRAYIQEELKKFLIDPQVTVQVQFYGSLRYYLLGEFRTPGLVYADRPMNLLEATTLAGGINEKAGLRGAYVLREGKKLPVNVQRLVRYGDVRQNVRLHPNDVVYVPDSSAEVVYVFAEDAVAVPMVQGQLNVVQALAGAGLKLINRLDVDLDDLRIIRLEADRGTYFVVDGEAMLHGEAVPFALEPGDIVYVPETGIASWAQLMSRILPTLQALNALVQPYAFIRAVTQ